MSYKTKKELEAFNFTNRSKEELSKINKQSGRKSEGAKKRWFRHNNPDISALMELYKSGNVTECMEKYMNDNEKFMTLYKEANSIEQKRRVLHDYQQFQLKIHELMFGNKLDMKLQADVKMQTMAGIIVDRLSEWKKYRQKQALKVIKEEPKKEIIVADNKQEEIEEQKEQEEDEEEVYL
jgi:hypothetical protein